MDLWNHLQSYCPSVSSVYQLDAVIAQSTLCSVYSVSLRSVPMKATLLCLSSALEPNEAELSCQRLLARPSFLAPRKAFYVSLPSSKCEFRQQLQQEEDARWFSTAHPPSVLLVELPFHSRALLLSELLNSSAEITLSSAAIAHLAFPLLTLLADAHELGLVLHDIHSSSIMMVVMDEDHRQCELARNNDEDGCTVGPNSSINPPSRLIPMCAGLGTISLWQCLARARVTHTVMAQYHATFPTNTEAASKQTMPRRKDGNDGRTLPPLFSSLLPTPYYSKQTSQTLSHPYPLLQSPVAKPFSVDSFLWTTPVRHHHLNDESFRDPSSTPSALTTPIVSHCQQQDLVLQKQTNTLPELYARTLFRGYGAPTAPECYLMESQQQPSNQPWTPEADVFALGSLLLALAIGQEPTSRLYETVWGTTFTEENEEIKPEHQKTLPEIALLGQWRSLKQRHSKEFITLLAPFFDPSPVSRPRARELQQQFAAFSDEDVSNELMEWFNRGEREDERLRRRQSIRGNVEGSRRTPLHQSVRRCHHHHPLSHSPQRWISSNPSPINAKQKLTPSMEPLGPGHVSQLLDGVALLNWKGGSKDSLLFIPNLLKPLKDVCDCSCWQCFSQTQTFPECITRVDRCDTPQHVSSVAFGELFQQIVDVRSALSPVPNTIEPLQELFIKCESTIPNFSGQLLSNVLTSVATRDPHLLKAMSEEDPR